MRGAIPQRDSGGQKQEHSQTRHAVRGGVSASGVPGRGTGRTSFFFSGRGTGRTSQNVSAKET
jgi:hypothetical protein